MIWAILATASALCWAVLAEINRHHCIDEKILNFWRSVSALAVFLAFAPIMQWPASLSFYGMSVVDGVFGLVMWAVLLHLSSKKCSRVTSLYSAFATGVSFVLWLACNEAQRSIFLNTPILLLGCLASFAMTIWGAQIIRRNDTSWWAFKRVVWVGLALGVIDVLLKLVMPAGSATAVFPVALAFCLVSFSVSSVGGLMAIRQFLPAEILSRKNILVGVQTGVASAAGILFYLLALQQAPNPAFAGVICMTTPVWILMYHKARGIEDPAKPVAAIMIMLGAGLLIVLMNQVVP